ncbi:MAG TPA: type IV toxin-antitoxin system AbiEi family antitoxin [Candidatus Obscuribacterales bacterium]
MRLGLTEGAFAASATRLSKKQKLWSPWRGFYVILRPEDRIAGAPDAVRWIDPLMAFLKIDYRISLLKAAAFHGSSHQASMVFQVVLPKQLRGFEAGLQRIQFVYQKPDVFGETNRTEFLRQLKSETGFAKVANLELTLLDCARYFRGVGGINGFAQIVHDLGSEADSHKLAGLANYYENAAVRRLGYMLDMFACRTQAKSLLPFARIAKSMKLLDPSVRPLIEGLEAAREKDKTWKLIINEAVEIDVDSRSQARSSASDR